MNLEKKKILAAKTLKVGKNRIFFNNERLAEIKEAITKQDIRELYKDGAIKIKNIKGRRKKEKRKTKRRCGKIKGKKKLEKETYVKLTRKLRSYLKELRKQNKLDAEKYKDLRIKIKSKTFKNKAHLKDYLREGGIM